MYTKTGSGPVHRLYHNLTYWLMMIEYSDAFSFIPQYHGIYIIKRTSISVGICFKDWLNLWLVIPITVSLWTAPDPILVWVVIYVALMMSCTRIVVSYHSFGASRKRDIRSSIATMLNVNTNPIRTTANANKKFKMNYMASG